MISTTSAVKFFWNLFFDSLTAPPPTHFLEEHIQKTNYKSESALVVRARVVDTILYFESGLSILGIL